METEHIEFVLGDDWQSRVWAVLIRGAPVDLTVGGWSVRAQARVDRDGAAPAAVEWSTANGRIRIGSVPVKLSDGSTAATSTVQAWHGPESETWAPFDGEWELEVTRRSQGIVVQNFTVVGGRCSARRGVSR